MPFQFFSNWLTKKDPVIVMPFGGYLTDSKIIAHARVLEDEGIRKEADGIVNNLINSYKRFGTDEIKGATVQAMIGNKRIETISDSEGYITLQDYHEQSFKKQEKTQWIPCTYTLKKQGQDDFSVIDYLMLPSNNISYGIISDIDETVISTGLESKFKWKVLVSTLLQKSEDRTPIEQSNIFYEYLRKGNDGSKDNPFFYISNSPWNLHHYLQDFLHYNNFPNGSLILRDIGLRNGKVKSFQDGNKYLKIAQILRSFPKMQFVLIGDAVEIDADIYIEIAKRFPNQVKTIFIYHAKENKKVQRVSALIEENTDIHVELVESVEQAIHFAKFHGLIP